MHTIAHNLELEFIKNSAIILILSIIARRCILTMSISEESTYAEHAVQVFKFLHTSRTEFYRKLRRTPLCARCIGCIRVCAQHPAYIRRAPMHTHDSDGPTWRMSSRAIKGPVGKRLMTICPEHVSERPPGNKGPLRRRPLSLSLRPNHSILPLHVRSSAKATAQPASREQ